MLTDNRYNANVKELQDTAGSEYFKFLSRKAHEGASNQAKIDVANAQMIGNIGKSSLFLTPSFCNRLGGLRTIAVLTEVELRRG